MKKIIEQFSYFISALPIIILIVFSVSSNTHIIDGSTGFFEDYPALWLTGVGFIINTAILKNYIKIIRNGKLYIFENKFMKYLLFVVTLFLSWLINHQWVISQLNNDQITWTTIGGQIEYPFAVLSEAFNSLGLFYYFTCIMFWMLVLVLTLLFTTSVIVYIYKVIRHIEIKVDSDQYLIFSGSIIAAFLIYYVSLQINDIILEGLGSFEKHNNRIIMIFLSFFFILVYLVILNVVRSQNRNSPVKINYEIMSDVFLITGPFIIITVVTAFLRSTLDYDSYLIYSIYSFAVLIVTIIIIAINQYTKENRLKTVFDVMEENVNLSIYTSNIEKLYQEMRAFKHDHKNIMLSINWFIKNNDMEGLKEFYDKELIKTSATPGSQYLLINRIALIQDLSLKGVLLNKIGLCEEKGIKVSIDIESFEMNINSLDLSRIVGILMDNAFEAAFESEDKHIIILLIKNEIIIKNTYSGNINLGKISNFGTSSKSKNRGIGLFSLKHILKDLPYKLITSIDCDYFIQKIK